ncbi:MAG TPA: ATP-binding protein [Nitrospiria bacterium]|nr:ATP-binding protein [Nitrospiria bacterium]
MIFRTLIEAGQYLVEISRLLSSDLTDGESAHILFQQLKKLLSVDKTAIFFLNEEKERFDLQMSIGVSERDFPVSGFEENGTLPLLLKNRSDFLFKSSLSSREHPDIIPLFEQSGFHLCLPFLARGKLSGFAFLGLSQPDLPIQADERQFLLLIGEQAALAINNILIAKALKKSKVLVRRTDRLKSLETIAGGMAHEIRNPLTSIKTFVELAGQRRDDPDFFTNFSKIAKEDIQRIERIIREVLDYSRYMEPVFTPEDLNEVIQTTLPFMVVEANKRGGRFMTEYDPNLTPTVIDRQQIKQVLLNLFINAIDALPAANGVIQIKTSGFKKQDVPWVRIEITDNGIGILPENMENIFDPFFTTKHDNKEREGTGLGLAIVHQIIQEHRGEVEVRSRPKEGATFIINIPSNPMVYERRKDRKAPGPTAFTGPLS